MNRVKWMRAKFPGSIRSIGKQLQKANFSPETDQGFVVDRIRDEYLEARYFERVAFQESINDPFGNTFLVDRLTFREVDFTLTKTFPELELRMAPRGLKGFASGLLKASGFSMELEQHTVKLGKWISAIERDLKDKTSMRAAVASGIDLGGGIMAKIAVTGPIDVRPGLTSLIPTHPYELETVQIDYPFGSSTQRLILGADSTLKYGARIPQEVIDLIRDALQAASAKGLN